MDEINILNSQLTRIRQMNNFYHKQFLLDVRLLFFFTVIFFYLSRTNINALLIIPFISLFGSVLLSFHAHYLIFTRNYSQFLEEKINKIIGNDLLIGHKLENSYLFPIQDRKIVVVDYVYGTICYYTTFKGSKCRFLHVTFSSLEAKPLGNRTFHQKDKILLRSWPP